MSERLQSKPSNKNMLNKRHALTVGAGVLTATAVLAGYNSYTINQKNEIIKSYDTVQVEDFFTCNVESVEIIDTKKTPLDKSFDEYAALKVNTSLNAGEGIKSDLFDEDGKKIGLFDKTAEMQWNGSIPFTAKHYIKNAKGGTSELPGKIIGSLDTTAEYAFFNSDVDVFHNLAEQNEGESLNYSFIVLANKQITGERTIQVYPTIQRVQLGSTDEDIDSLPKDITSKTPCAVIDIDMSKDGLINNAKLINPPFGKK